MIMASAGRNEVGACGWACAGSVWRPGWACARWAGGVRGNGGAGGQWPGPDVCLPPAQAVIMTLVSPERHQCHDHAADDHELEAGWRTVGQDPEGGWGVARPGNLVVRYIYAAKGTPRRNLIAFSSQLITECYFVFGTWSGGTSM